MFGGAWACVLVVKRDVATEAKEVEAEAPIAGVSIILILLAPRVRAGSESVHLWYV